jgi:hypothetical protein
MARARTGWYARTGRSMMYCSQEWYDGFTAFQITFRF